jgi:hypothetical protein
MSVGHHIRTGTMHWQVMAGQYPGLGTAGRSAAFMVIPGSIVSAYHVGGPRRNIYVGNRAWLV